MSMCEKKSFCKTTFMAAMRGANATLVFVFAFVLLVSLLMLSLQHSATSSHTTLRERLQQVPEQVIGVVTAVQKEDVRSLAQQPTTTAAAHVIDRRGAAFPQGPRAKNASMVAAVSSGLKQSQKYAAAAAKAAIEASDAHRRRRPPLEQVVGPHSQCAHRKPYHVVLTAASGIYQEWQTRIAYFHYKKLKAEFPCSDLGGFTRLLNTPNARPDGLMDEIPTVLVSHLERGWCNTCRPFITTTYHMQLPPATCYLPLATCYLPLATSQFPIPNSQFPIPNSHLPPATCHLPPTTCHLPPVTCHLPFNR